MKALCLFLAFVCIHLSAHAQTHSLQLETGGDSSDNNNSSLSYAYTTQSFWRYSFLGSSSRRKQDRNALNSQSFSFSVFSNIEKPWVFGAELSQWGLRGQFAFSELGIPIEWNGKWGSIGVRPAGGRIRYSTTATNNDPNQIRHRSLGFSADFDYLWPWGIGLSMTRYSYEKDPALITNSESEALTDTAWNLSQSLVTHSSQYYFSYDFKNIYLRLNVSNAKSAIDESSTTASSINIDYRMSDSWTLLGTLGSSRVTDWGLVAPSDQTDDKSSYVLVGFRYVFGSINKIGSDVSE